MTTTSSDVADEEQFLFTQADVGNEIKEQILQQKKQSLKEALERLANQELSSMKPSVKVFAKADGNTTLYFMNGIKSKARRRVEQDAYLFLKTLELKLFGQPHDDVPLAADRRFKHNKAKEDRIIVQDELLFRKHY